MKKLLVSLLLGLAVLSLTGCGEDEKPAEKTAETDVMKCEAGKCGSSMEKESTQ